MIVRFFPITSGPPVSVIVPEMFTMIVSPATAPATASRRDPGPLSNVLVTITVLANARGVTNRIQMINPAVTTFVAAHFGM
jgi:hypothetical protein